MVNLIFCADYEELMFDEFTSEDQTEEYRLASFLIDHAPDQIKDVLFCLQHPELFAKADFPTRLLLVGPPGVGKTTLAVAIAQCSDRPYAIIKCSMVGDKYQNSGPDHLKNQIQPLIESEMPVIVIVDEINLLSEKFDDELSPDKKTASAFWQYLDEIEKRKHILFIGTTNDISALPEPLKDRFEGNIVEIVMPSVDIKKEIVHFYLQDVQHELSIIPMFLAKSKKISIRNIKQLILRAKRKAVIRTNQPDPMLTVDDVSAAIRDFEYTESWRAWLQAHHKQIEKHAPHIISWTFTALGLYLSYCHYLRLLPMELKTV